ncbi:MAG: MFS transporter [Pirellula sp.]|jgi:MFS family permease|nr:MFS transporter [Pirellula sp.]
MPKVVEASHQANPPSLSARNQTLVLVVAFAALVFDGVELGLMPVASLSVSQSLLGDAYTPTLGGDWFARFTASLMLGAAIGGIALGSLGDRIGRTRAMGISILFYSVFAAMGAWAQTQEQMLVLRFLVGLGVGGLWPNGIALVAECWPSAKRPFVSGAMMAGLNTGILLLSQLARVWPVTAESWRWIFYMAGAPVFLGLFVLVALPESPRWLATLGGSRARSTPLRELFSPGLIRITLVAIAVSAIPMIGAWSASKWMIPWADQVAGKEHGSYKAITQGYWALGAVIGSFAGAQLASWLGRRRSYAWISFGAVTLTWAMFLLTAPLRSEFHAIVFAQGMVSTLFFGWLALYLPELFPTRVRATGSGLAYNSGRFATAVGVLLAGFLFASLGGNYSRVGALCALVYVLGLVVIWFAPDTRSSEL